MTASQQKYDDIFRGIMGLEYTLLERIRIALTIIADSVLTACDWIVRQLGA